MFPQLKRKWKDRKREREGGKKQKGQTALILPDRRSRLSEEQAVAFVLLWA